MTKKTIAVDLDDVLAENVPAFLEYSNKKWGTNLTIEGFVEDWAVLWKVDHTEIVARAEQMRKDKLRKSYKHFPEALPVLNNLGKRYRLVIATSRQKFLAADTTEWLDKYFHGIFEEIHYAGMWDNVEDRTNANHVSLMTKTELVKQIGADYLIDDYPKHCIDAAEAGIQTVLFGDYPWNRNVEASKGVARAHDWSEVESYFDGQQD